MSLLTFTSVALFALLQSSLFPSWTNAYLATNGIFPRLIEATTDDLVAGLDSGLFTSVDLVNVS